jgi:hypothetical protein
LHRDVLAGLEGEQRRHVGGKAKRSHIVRFLGDLDASDAQFIRDQIAISETPVGLNNVFVMAASFSLTGYRMPAWQTSYQSYLSICI